MKKRVMKNLFINQKSGFFFDNNYCNFNIPYNKNEKEIILLIFILINIYI